MARNYMTENLPGSDSPWSHPNKQTNKQTELSHLSLLGLKLWTPWSSGPGDPLGWQRNLRLGDPGLYSFFQMVTAFHGDLPSKNSVKKDIKTQKTHLRGSKWSGWKVGYIWLIYTYATWIYHPGQAPVVTNRITYSISLGDPRFGVTLEVTWLDWLTSVHP